MQVLPPVPSIPAREDSFHSNDIATLRAQAREQTVLDTLKAGRDAADKAIVTAPNLRTGGGPTQAERAAARKRIEDRNPREPWTTEPPL